MDSPRMVDLVEEDTQEGRFLTFLLGAETYGIEIRFVIEIIGIRKVTPVPETPEHIRGVINLRGKVIPVFDVRLRFRMDARPRARLLTGHSSGGWSTLWLQITYPGVFGATWSTSPERGLAAILRPGQPLGFRAMPGGRSRRARAPAGGPPAPPPW